MAPAVRRRHELEGEWPHEPRVEDQGAAGPAVIGRILGRILGKEVEELAAGKAEAAE